MRYAEISLKARLPFLINKKFPFCPEIAEFTIIPELPFQGFHNPFLCWKVSFLSGKYICMAPMCQQVARGLMLLLDKGERLNAY
jgi:hypothetical protein